MLDFIQIRDKILQTEIQGTIYSINNWLYFPTIKRQKYIYIASKK